MVKTLNYQNLVRWHRDLLVLGTERKGGSDIAASPFILVAFLICCSARNTAHTQVCGRVRLGHCPTQQITFQIVWLRINSTVSSVICIFLVWCWYPSKKGVWVYSNLFTPCHLVSSQRQAARSNVSVETKQSECFVNAKLTHHTCTSTGDSLLLPNCLLSIGTVTPSHWDSNYVNRSTSLKLFRFKSRWRTASCWE